MAETCRTWVRSKCTYGAKWNFCICFLLSLRFSLFQGLPSSVFNVSFFVIQILLFSFPSLILIHLLLYGIPSRILNCEFCFPIFTFCDQCVNFSFRLSPFIILKFTQVVGFSMPHLPLGIRLSVLDFQPLVVGVKSSDYQVLPFGVWLLELKPSYTFH